MTQAKYSGPMAGAFGNTRSDDPYCLPDDRGVIHCPTCREVALRSPAPSEDSADRKAAEVARSPQISTAERSPLREPDSGAWHTKECRNYGDRWRCADGCPVTTPPPWTASCCPTIGVGVSIECSSSVTARGGGPTYTCSLPRGHRGEHVDGSVRPVSPVWTDGALDVPPPICNFCGGPHDRTGGRGWRECAEFLKELLEKTR